MNFEGVIAWTKRRPELAVPVVVLLATLVFPKHAPLGVYALGLESASMLLLPAVAIILVHRSNRIVNFSQVVIATTTATFFTVMTESRQIVFKTATGTRDSGINIGYFPVARGISKVCQGCVDKVGIDPEFLVLRRGTFLANYGFSIVAALAFALVLTMATYLIVQRFSGAPRLIVTVATIFVAQAVSFLAPHVVNWLVPENMRGTKGLGYGAVPPPWEARFTFGGVTFELVDMIVVVVAIVIIALVGLYVTRSKAGTAIRAAAENPARVATLGIHSGKIISKVWVVAGLLAGASGIALAMVQGRSSGASPLSLELLVRILAVAVIARMTSVPIAVGSAIALGMAEQAGRYAFGSNAVLDGSLLAVIGVALIVQRRRESRAQILEAGSWEAEREIRPIPRELRGIPTVRTWLRTLTFIAVALAVGLPWLLDAGQTTVATLIPLYGMVLLSLLVLTGWTGQISLGQGALAAFGAYAAAWSGMPFVVALLVGAITGAVVATIIGIPALRLRGLNLAIISLAFAVSTSSFLLDRHYLGKHLPRRIDRPSFLGLNLDDQRSYYYLTLVLLGLVTMAVLGMRRSRTARVLIALRDNEQTAQSFGIPATRSKLAAFAVSGAIAGFGGALIAYADGAVDPSRFTPDFGVNMFLAGVVGGFGTVAGPILGALYQGLPPFLGSAGATVSEFGGLLGLALLVAVGGGLSQLVFRGRDNMLRRVANRYGIVVPSLVADLRTEGLVHKAPIEPKRRASGGTAFVPLRYRMTHQWAFGAEVPLQAVDDEGEVQVG